MGRVEQNQEVGHRSHCCPERSYRSLPKRQVRSKSTLNCVMFNAQSIRSKFNEFECYVAIEQPDVICITETWVSEGFNGDRLQDFELPGYNMFSYCRESRQGGGVFVYVNSLCCTARVEVASKVIAVESLWLDLKTGTGNRSRVRIGAFYRAGNLPRDAQAELDLNICEEIRRNFRAQCIIMGDFNLRGYERTQEDTNDCRLFRQVFEEELFMHQFVAEATRRHSILDLIFSDNRDLVSDIRICEGLGNSDHNMIKFNVSSETRPKDNLLLVPNFNQADFDSIRHDLAEIDWNTEMEDLDSCEAWNVFKDKIKLIQSRHIPFRHKRNRIRNNPVWLSQEIRGAIRAKRTTFNSLKGSPLESNHRAYQKARNEVKKMVRAAKRAKELDLAKHCKSDSKKFFSFYKLNSGSKSIGPFKVNDELVSKDSEIVELLNSRFKSVFTVEDESNFAALQPQQLTNESIGDIGNITSELVLTHIKKIRPNKAEGPDEIHARFLREGERELSVPLAIIFTKSLTETKMPLDWKRANVVPIFKKGDRSEIGNYRPVSLTSLVCKVLETIIKDKIVEFLDVNRLIKDTQHGFRKGRSCLTNLLEFLDVATNSFDQGKQLDVSYLDFSKAFDKVPHKRLGLQLEKHGIRGNTLKWIQLWLSGRQQRVILNGCKSGWQGVISGVPQGSVLGPLLFIIFVNAIENNIDSKILKFADDVKLVRVIEGKHDQEVFQSDLNMLVKWSKDWQMEFNLAKCKILHTGRVDSEIVYEMDGHRLDRIEKEKDLGVIINNKLSSSDQVVDSRKRALRMLGAINRNVSYKSEEVITKLYCAYVRPLLEYCVQAWSPTYEKDCWLLERVQKRATKMVTCLRSLPYEDRLRKLGMFSLRYRRLRGDLIEVFKFVKGHSSGYLKGMFEFNGAVRGRGHQYKLIMKQSRTRLRQSFFSRRVVGHWNRLPENVAAAGSLMSFKVKLDQHFTERGLVYQYSWNYIF